jgi:prepilin-type N-terminal cleavage/methylation domain-containing protein
VGIDKKDKKGFTIIEVVLVLAIAGLIFMMVFIALPALQRNQRDTQRKNDLSRLETALTQYTSNNRGSLPTNWTTFENQYLLVDKDTFGDPLGKTDAQTSDSYVLTATDGSDLTGKFADNQNIIYYTEGYSCDDGGSVTKASSRKVAFRMYLEGGGVACRNN